MLKRQVSTGPIIAVWLDQKRKNDPFIALCTAWPEVCNGNHRRRIGFGAWYCRSSRYVYYAHILQPSKQFLGTNGTRLEYLDWGGDGRSLLFLPGMGCSAHIFDTFAPLFTPQYRAVSLSRRGHGESAPLSVDLGLSTLADDIEALTDHLGLEKVSVVAHSFGCAEASHFCARNPDRVDGVVLLDGGYDYRKLNEVGEDDPLDKVERPVLQGISNTSEFFDRVRHIRPDLDFIWHEFSEAYLSGFVKLNNEGFVQERTNPDTYKTLQRILFSYEPEWHKHDVPLLSIFAMWDVHEHSLPDYLSLSQREAVVDFIDRVKVPAQRRWIKSFRDSVSRAKVSVIEKGHHYCFLSHKQETTQLIKIFLAGGE